MPDRDADTPQARLSELGQGRWSVDRLLLDGGNPRLPEELRDADQATLLAYVEANYDLEELGWSMAERGYFDEEPLLVIDAQDDPDCFVTVEGNRRLATLKLLTSEVLRGQIGRRIWHTLAQRLQENGFDLSEVPVRHYASRAALLEYLGFRHVSGLLGWDPDAKARFVHQLIVEHGYDFQGAARTIGSRSDAIRRQFLAWSAIEQARQAGIDVEPSVRRFGVLYRALQNPDNRTFLEFAGWADADESVREPLGPHGLERFAEFQGFIFGPDRVIRESRQLDQLGKALSEPLALETLRQQRDIDAAVRELPEDRNAVLATMRAAYRSLAEVNGQVFQFPGDEALLVEAQRIEKVVSLILQVLRPETEDGTR